MNRAEKETVVALLKQDLASSKGLFLVGYRGMTVGQLQRLRKKVREGAGHIRVAKVRLVKRALAGVEGADALEPLLKEQLALVFADGESPAIAKIIYNFSKEVEALKVVGGFLDSQLLPAHAVEKIAMLPSKEVLLAYVCGVVKAPICNFVGLFNNLPAKLVRVLSQIGQQKQA